MQYHPVEKRTGTVSLAPNLEQSQEGERRQCDPLRVLAESRQTEAKAWLGGGGGPGSEENWAQRALSVREGRC